MTHKHTPAPWTVTKHFYVIDVHGVLADDEIIAGDIGSLADANLSPPRRICSKPCT